MATTTAGQVAAELRCIADVLDKQPDTVIAKPDLNFWCDEKDVFLTTAKMFPHPLKKRMSGSDGDSYRRLYIEHDRDAVKMTTSIYQSQICELVEPAKPAVYHCPSILSAEEEEALGAF